MASLNMGSKIIFMGGISYSYFGLVEVLIPVSTPLLLKWLCMAANPCSTAC